MAVIFPPDRMMIIEDDGSEKHERMFTLKNGEVEWWKPNDEWWKPNRWTRANKSPSTLRTVERYGKSEAGLLRLVTSNGVNRIVRPRDDEMRERWLTARLSDEVDGRPSDTEEMRLRTRNVERKPHTAAPRRMKPPRRSSGSLADDALSDPGSDVSEPSLLSFSRADSALSEALETLQQREEELRRSEVQQRQEELWRREEELRQRKMAAQARIAEADAEAAEARNQRRLDEARRPPQRLTPQRLTPRRLTCTPQRRPNGVLRRSCRDYDIALHQRVQYLSESQGRWVSATVTRLNSDLSVDFVGEDGLIRENYFIFRNGRRVIR